MGTPCNIKFGNSANIYLHWDGYPQNVMSVLHTFVKAVETHCEDTRFNDMDYLASKFVVFQSRAFAKAYDVKTGDYVKSNSLDFLSIGIVPLDTGESHQYHVTPNPDGGWPKVRYIGSDEVDDEYYNYPLDKELCELWEVT